MSAQRLRDAAEVLREAAEGADLKGEPTESDLEALRSADFGAIFMAPAAAVALADWLDDIVVVWEAAESMADEDGDPLAFGESIDSHALKVADAILGATA